MKCEREGDAMVTKAKRKTKRGERVGTFSRLGKATPTGIVSLMPGVVLARGTFVPMPKRKPKRKAKRARSKG